MEKVDSGRKLSKAINVLIQSKHKLEEKSFCQDMPLNLLESCKRLDFIYRFKNCYKLHKKFNQTLKSRNVAFSFIYIYGMLVWYAFFYPKQLILCVEVNRDALYSRRFRRKRRKEIVFDISLKLLRN